MDQAEGHLSLLVCLTFCLKSEMFFKKSCYLWHVFRSPQALNSNPRFGVKGPGDNSVSSAIFLSSSVLQRIFWKGGSVVYCLSVSSRNEYHCRIFSVLSVSLPASWTSWAVLWLRWLLYLSRVSGTCFLNLCSCRNGFQVEFFAWEYSTSRWEYSICPFRF